MNASSTAGRRMTLGNLGLRASLVVAAAAIASTLLWAQSPWTVTVTPTLNPLPVGFCSPVQVTVTAPGGDTPRSPSGARVTISDFDMSVTGSSVIGHQIDASHWQVCACQGATVGSVANVKAVYPAAALTPRARVDGVKFEMAATITLAAAKGALNPAPCVASVATAASGGAGAAGGGVAGAGAAGRLGGAAAGTPAGTTTAAGAAASGDPGAAAGAGAGTVRGTAGGVSIPAIGTVVPPTTGRTGAGTTTGTAAGTVVGTVTAGTARTPAITPVNPATFTAVQTVPGQVRLTWAPVAGATYYVLFGPGVPAGGAKVTGATTYMATALPPGTHQWAVGSYYEPGPVSTAASAFPRATASVTGPPRTNDHYRVVATRFSVTSPTEEGGLIPLDGVGDEVFGLFGMLHFDRATNVVLNTDLRRTAVIGDQGKGYLRGGSKGAAGGFGAGDSFPSSTFTIGAGTESWVSGFPFVIWDGVLTDAKDALVILPTMWEADGDDVMTDQWFVSEMGRASTIWADSGIQAAVQGRVIGTSAGGAGGEVITDRRIGLTAPSWVPGGSGIKRNTADNFFTNLAEFAFVGPMTRDRPIGIAYRTVSPVLPPMMVLPRRAIVLTREALEASLPPVPGASTGTSDAEMYRKLMEMMAKAGVTGASVAFESSAPSSSTPPASSTTPAGSGEALAGMGPESTQITVPLNDGPGPFMGGQYMLTISIQRLH